MSNSPEFQFCVEKPLILNLFSRKPPAHVSKFPPFVFSGLSIYERGVGFAVWFPEYPRLQPSGGPTDRCIVSANHKALYLRNEPTKSYQSLRCAHENSLGL